VVADARAGADDRQGRDETRGADAGPGGVDGMCAPEPMDV
jgi:hypothetical protein